MTLGHVSNLQLALEDGRRLRFDEVFSGYAPQEGLFADALPFLEADIGLVTYQALQAVFPAYDTNDNGHLETPELTLLYLSEVAGGLGYPVRAIHNESSTAGSTAGRVFALVLSQSELGGLIEFAKSRQSQLSDRARKILVELDRLGQEILNDADGPDQSGDLIIKI